MPTPSRADAVVGALLLTSCATAPPERPREVPRFATPRAVRADFPVKLGRPYAVGGVTYVPTDDPTLDQVGLATWYGQELAGARTASGEVFDPLAITAAHRTLPLPSYVEVTALDSGRTILVRVNDRGPFTQDRLIDLSLGAARQLGLAGGGARQVRVRRVEPDESERQALREGRAVPMRSRGTATEPAPRSAAPLPVGESLWYLQVASFVGEERARSLAATVGGEVVQVGETYRVRIGPFETAERAREALEPLARRGYPGAIITR